jgi:LPXTG-motif cell wall-anchored protein
VTEETTVQEITTISEETVMVTTTTTEETTTTTDDGLIDLFDDDNPMGDVDVDDNGNVGGDDRLPKTGTTPIVYYVGFGLIALILGTVIVSGKREEEN